MQSEDVSFKWSTAYWYDNTSTFVPDTIIHTINTTAFNVQEAYSEQAPEDAVTLDKDARATIDDLVFEPVLLDV